MTMAYTTPSSAVADASTSTSQNGVEPARHSNEVHDTLDGHAGCERDQGREKSLDLITKRAADSARRLTERTSPLSADATLILQALLEMEEAQDVLYISRVTGIGSHELSWRLGRMTQRDLLSRVKRRNKVTGERFFYFLNPNQAAYAQTLPVADQRDETDPCANDNVKILRLLIEADAPLDTTEMAQTLGMSRNDLAWRLTTLIRQDQIARTRKNVTQNYRYFFRRDQRAAVLEKLDVGRAHREREGQIVLLKQNISEADDRAAQLTDEVVRLEKTLEERQKQVDLLNQQKSKLTHLNAQALARAQSNPIALSQHLSFIKKLRERPALQDEVRLREIQMDYEGALRMARGE